MFDAQLFLTWHALQIYTDDRNKNFTSKRFVFAGKSDYEETQIWYRFQEIKDGKAIFEERKPDGTRVTKFFSRPELKSLNFEFYFSKYGFDYKTSNSLVAILTVPIISNYKVATYALFKSRFQRAFQKRHDQLALLCSVIEAFKQQAQNTPAANTFGISMSLMELFNSIHGARTIARPDYKQVRDDFIFNLDSLVGIEAITRNNRGDYRLNPVAHSILISKLEDDRRHREIKSQGNRMLLLTSVIAVATFIQALSQKDALVSGYKFLCSFLN